MFRFFAQIGTISGRRGSVLRLDVDESLECRSNEVLARVVHGPFAAQDTLTCPNRGLIGTAVTHRPSMEKTFGRFARIADDPIPAYSVEFEDDGVLPPLLNHSATSCNRLSI
jgi:hypothetical protein